MGAARAIVLGAVLLTASAGGAACGGGGADGGGDVGTGHAARGKQPVELELRTHEEVLVNVGDYRGQTMLLFLFGTFDGVSQAAVHDLARFVRHHPEVYVLGIAVQPKPGALLGGWHDALNPPFAVTYSPEDRLTQGTSELGVIQVVPTFVVLDKQGYEVARAVGMLSEAQLERLTQ